MTANHSMSVPPLPPIYLQYIGGSGPTVIANTARCVYLYLQPCFWVTSHVTLVPSTRITPQAMYKIFR